MDMENAGLGAFHDEEWESSISNMFTFEAPDFGAQFLSHPTNNNSSIVTPLFENEFFYNSLPSILHPNNSNSEFHSDNASDTTSYNYTSQATNSSENCHFSMANDALSTTILNVEDSNSSQLGSEKGNISLDNNNIGSPLHSEVQLKRKSNATEVEPDVKLKAELNKKARISNDNGKKSIESKKNTKQRESNVCEAEISDDDSMISEQTSVLEISTSKGKKRASKGTATDPQSVYARRRREKINERLKILQNLVPNGTKVDISTMLEEAVQYVKFLQLQIRLLSSDDLWMYAPIAYNGVDMGLYKRISPFQLP